MPPVAFSSSAPPHLWPSGRRYVSRKRSNLCATCSPSPPASPVFVQSRILSVVEFCTCDAARWVDGGFSDLLAYGVLRSSLTLLTPRLGK
jgi:hypothetical protein